LSPQFAPMKQFIGMVMRWQWTRQRYSLLLLIIFLIIGLSPHLNLSAEDNSLILVNCTIYTMTDRGIIENGTLWVSNGRVEQVMERFAVNDSYGNVIDLNGGYVLPGLIDPHSIYNIPGTGSHRQEPSAIQENIVLTDEEIDTALAHGITTVALRQPADSLISGYSALVHLLPESLGGPIIEQDTLDLQVSIEGPVYTYTVSPKANRDSERMKRLYRFRDIVRDLKEPHPNTLQRDGKSNAIEHAVNHRIPLYVLVDNAMGFLQAREVVQSLEIPVYYGRMSKAVEAIRESGRSIRYYSIPSRLGEIGVRYAVGSFREFPPNESLLDEVRKLNMYGVTELEALGAITVIPGRTLHPRSNLGTITPGAQANFVVLDKPPMDVHGKVVLTIVNGYPIWRQR